MEKLRIGLAGAVHPNMPGDDRGLYARVVERMTALAPELDYDLSVFREPLRSEADGERARDFMDGERVDLTLLFNASLPFGRVILPLARVKSRLGLWSVPEPTRSGVLQLNSFCGTNMLGSIVGNYLRHHRIPFKWFYGDPDAVLFRERFGVTLRALRAVKRLATARVAQVGGLAAGFENMYFDERTLDAKLGTYLQTRHTVEEIVERARRCPGPEVEAELAALRGEGRVEAVQGEHLERSARVFLALRDLAREHRYDALAVSCWSRFQEVYGVAVCGAMSRLNQLGIVTPCEGDVGSAVVMLAMNAMNGGRASLNDLVAFDDEDRSLALWHCGVAPACWADGSGVVWANHFNIGERAAGGRWEGAGVVAEVAFKPGAVTLACVNDAFDNLLIVTGEVMAGKRAYAGSSGWVNHLRLDGQEVDLPTLMETIVTERVNHHYPAAQGDLTAELNELAAWKGLRVLEPVPYRPYMQNPRQAPGHVPR